MNKPRMIQIRDPELSDMGHHPMSGDLGTPILWLNTRDSTYWADADELRLWRSTRTSNGEQS